MHDDLVKLILIKEEMDDKDDLSAFDEMKSKKLFLFIVFYYYIFYKCYKKILCISHVLLIFLVQILLLSIFSVTNTILLYLIDDIGIHQ